MRHRFLEGKGRGGMLAVIDRAPWRDAIDIYVQTRHERLTDEGWVPRVEGRDLDQPTLSVQYDVWEAIVEAVRSEPGGSADEVALDALRDARGTRDRLLAMLEGLA